MARSRVGEFRISKHKDGLALLIFGPRDRAEAEAGVPQIAFALWDKQPPDHDKMAAFLNAALIAQTGDYAPLKALFPRQSEAAE